MKITLCIRQSLILIFLLFSYCLVGQTIKGTVIDEEGKGIPFVNVIEKGTTNGTTTDEQGVFSLKVKKSPAKIIFSSLGFATIEKIVTSGKSVIVTLKEDNVLEEIVLTGNRSKPRTILDSPVPIDNVGVAELRETGQTNIDQMLTYAIPSYNATNQTISDATAHFDPADLRGLGPSRTLVLVNGKRKNQSALVYVNDTPGKGEVGTDMKSIPTAAIERVEVLRDGASAQYGSDAVAGVVNIILKKKVKHTEVNVNGGITKEGDGLNYGADVNHTFTFSDKGFVNATISGYHQNYTNRKANPGKDVLLGNAWVRIFKKEFADGNITQGQLDEGLVFAQTITNGTHPWIQENPNLGMIIGQPEMTKGDVFINSEFSFNKYIKLYASGGVNIRKGKSFALYRTPYWPGISLDGSNNPLYNGVGKYQGFQPTFETDIQDLLFTLGSRFQLGGFDADVSATYGGNSVDYTVGNSINTTLGANSPTSFNTGGYGFSNIVGNFDVSRSFGTVSLGLGIEGRQERFEVTAGQKESYEGKGTQSFPGLRPSNSLDENRTNIGAYASLDWDVSKKFLIGGAVRYENYSDFGGNTSWKINSRYKINEVGVLRASYSTGFRAPSLHQVYLSNKQTLLLNNGTIGEEGTFKNTDSVIKDLGVKELFAETSKNFSAGLTVKAFQNFTISLDYYNVRVNDRILFSGKISEKDDNGNVNTAVKKILDDNGVGNLKFFINAFNTITQGFDYTMRYRNIPLWSGKLGLNASLNVNKTDLDGEVFTPKNLVNYKNKIFDRKEQSRVTTARPNTKFLYGANYKVKKFNASINNTYFGEVTWQHASDPEKDQIFSGKTITDVSLGYKFSKMIAANITVNNVFDVYPDEIDGKGDAGTTLGGRFKYPWEVNQFGFNGMTFKAGLTFKF